jgi:2-(1,2-epoxy-1,2-dihydrophenyl)acetyl-CoA isomerase
MASTMKLLVSLQDGIKRIAINRPDRRNALDQETAQWLREAIEESADDGSRVVVLTGKGDAFCAGADLQAVHGGLGDFDVTQYLREVTNPTILAMRSLPIPVIARVHGAAAGVGCNFVLASDLVIASETATFGQAFVRIGLLPDGGSTFFLPRLVGHQRAFEMMVTGEQIGAEQAKALGFVNRVVPVQALDGTVDALAHRLMHGPAQAIAAIKGALFAQARDALAAALDLEAELQGGCFHSADFAEGVRAFAEKRSPVFAAERVGRS